MWVSQLGRAQWHISCCIWWHWSSFSGIWLVESSSEECKVVSPIRPVLWGDDWEAGHCWDCWLDCLSVVSPAWPCQDNWTLHMAAKGSQREFSKEHEVKCHHFLKAWAQKLAKHHFHHTLLCKAVTGTIQAPMRQHRPCLLMITRSKILHLFWIYHYPCVLILLHIEKCCIGKDLVNE